MDPDSSKDKKPSLEPRAPTPNRSSSKPPASPVDSSPRTSRDFASAQRQNTPARRKQSLSLSTDPSAQSQLGSGSADRVFPIRSVVSVDPTQTPAPRQHQPDGYFQHHTRVTEARRQSTSTEGSYKQSSARKAATPIAEVPDFSSTSATKEARPRQIPPRLPSELFSDARSEVSEHEQAGERRRSRQSFDASSQGFASDHSEDEDIVTNRFKHIVTEAGHAIITGRDGEMQRCEDEPIHIPGAIQSFGLLIALQEVDGKFIVRVVSENSRSIIGYTPQQLFALDSFTDILSEEQADNLLDHIDFIKDEDADVVSNGPEVFTLSIRTPKRISNRLWCAIHMNEMNRGTIICEFELEDDMANPLVPSGDITPELPQDSINSNPTREEYLESTHNASKPLRVLRSARKRKGEAAAMEVFNIMSQVQEQLAAAPNLDSFLKILVGVIKELTGFHRVMIYQFDAAWNGRVVTELLDPRATKDLYKGLNFPASDIPKQARELYKVNRVRLIYDRDQETARLVCRTIEDLEVPLDLTHSYLRAMSPIHVKYLGNMGVRSSMSVSINAFNELWGLISCHSYGAKGMRVSFPIRKMCRLVGDSASRNIERLSYASRLQARKLINTAPSAHNPSGYIVASSDDLLTVFNADFGLLSIQDETKILGQLEQSQEALALLEYLRMRRLTSVTSTQDVSQDFPDLRYEPGFKVIAGMLVVPLSVGGHDFIVFFRKSQLKEVKWAGNPYEKVKKEGTQAHLEPRKSFKIWCETIVGKCREWTEEEIETAAVLCLVYGKFIAVWRQKEAALQNSQLTRLLLANSAHEVRTPLNAIINYLEIALEGSLDQETRENLAKSHSASKSLIYVINDLLDLTKTEEGADLIKDEKFDLPATLAEATDPFKSDAKRKGIEYTVNVHPGVPQYVISDHRRIRQAIANVCANAIQHTSEGSVMVEIYTSLRENGRIDLEVVVEDTGSGMDSDKLDNLFRDLEQVQGEPIDLFGEAADQSSKQITQSADESSRTLGLGLAVVARIVRNMNGRLKLKSEEGSGSRFVIQLPLDLPGGEEVRQNARDDSTPQTPDAKEDSIVLVEKGPKRRASVDRRDLSRRDSTDSIHSKRSLRSFESAVSDGARSDVDRLIEAIQEPHMIDSPRRPVSGDRACSSQSHVRPLLEKRRSYDSEQGTMVSSKPYGAGTTDPDQFGGAPMRAVKMEDETGSPIVPLSLRKEPSGSVLGEVDARGDTQVERENSIRRGKGKARLLTPRFDRNRRTGGAQDQSVDAGCLSVLVAEDDPVNSKIVKKRMEKIGHTVVLTGNGQECASAYEESASKFDVVLMDMQMPIADGLASTKMIRSYEASNEHFTLSPRAAFNGRVPIIAVSASLLEKDRQIYIDAGFDGWILKPISFPRLNDLMEGIVNRNVRKDALYAPGSWEKGGWFELAKPERYTDPADSAESISDAETAETITPTPMHERDQTQELDAIARENAKSLSAPQLGFRGFPPQAKDRAGSSSDSNQTITGRDVVASPEPTDKTKSS